MVVSLLASALAVTLALAPGAVPSPAVGAAAVDPPPPTSGGDALGPEPRPVRSGRGGAALAYATATGAFAALLVMQTWRAAETRACARRIDDGASRRDLEVDWRCDVAFGAPARTAAAAGLSGLAITMAGVGGLALGRGDARLGTAIAPERINRRVVVGAAMLGTFAGLLVIATPVLRSAAASRVFEPGGAWPRLQRAQFIVTDVAVVGAAIGASILARAREYRLDTRRRPSVAVAPTLSAQGVGVSIAGRF